MNNFFTYKTNIDNNNGFGLFSQSHIMVLLLLLLLISYVIKYYIRLDDKARLKFRKKFVLIVLVSEALRQSSLLITNQYEMQALPLDLCALGWMIMTYDAFKTSEWKREVLYSLTLPGAFAALITPNWTKLPLFNLFSIQSFFIHACLVCYVIMVLKTGEFIPSIKKLWKPSLFLLITVPIIYVINKLLNTNFFFLNVAAPGSPLEPLQKLMGNYYILGMIALVLFTWLLLYLPWINKINNYQEKMILNEAE